MPGTVLLPGAETGLATPTVTIRPAATLAAGTGETSGIVVAEIETSGVYKFDTLDTGLHYIQLFSAGLQTGSYWWAKLAASGEIVAVDDYRTALAGAAGGLALAITDVDGYAHDEALKIILASVAGKLSGGGTATEIIRAADDSKARITATVDSLGNRTAITLDATG